MKRYSLIALLGLLLGSLLLLNTWVDAAPPAKQTATPAAQATRKPRKTKTPTPASPARATPAPTATPAPATPAPPLPDDNSDTESAGALVPIAPGPMTSQILVLNPDPSGAATVQVDIYDGSGAVAYSTTTNVVKNGARLITLPASLGSNFQGGAQVSSDKNVRALVISANAANTARDAYEGATAPATTITLPLVRHLAQNTQNTTLAIQNTTGNSANVTVTLSNPDGSPAYSQNAVIAARQSLYLNTNQIFLNNQFVGSARITGDQNLAVTAQTLYFKDTAAFDGGSALDQDTTLYVSEAYRKTNTAGVVNWSEIFVRNNGANPTDITLNLYDTTGGLVSSKTISGVAASGQAQFLLNDTSDPAITALGGGYAGWAKITSSGEPVMATVLTVITNGKRLYSVDALPAAQLQKKYVCGDAARQTNQSSRLSILNTDSVQTARPIVQLFDPATGAKLTQLKLSLVPNSQATVLLSDPAFAAAGTSYEGMAIVVARGAAAPKLVVTVNNPYGSKKLNGTTGYTCSAVP